MGRPKGSKNKKTIFREQALVHRRAVAAKRASLIRNEPLQEVVAHTSDLDSLLVLEETMRHFYLKARIEESLGKDADWKAVDTAMVEAGRWARIEERKTKRLAPARRAARARPIVASVLTNR